MDTLVTVETILSWVEKQVAEKQPIDPHLWMEIAFKINALLQTEQEKLMKLEQEVARLRNLLLDDGKSVAYSKVKLEATDEYLTMRKQKALIERALETIKLSKQHARLSSELMKNQLQ